ncbi:hypothetical protein TWF730_001621 [Orbilia blumenaviensis]|uniref:Hydrophobin n=1 Tax=Orbilia blumenaviensis TaxID=1796055 RepID=A0AAV9UI88_9PEZI
MYRSIISILMVVATAVATIPSTSFVEKLPKALTVGDVAGNCDFGLTVSCCAADSKKNIIDNSCYPLPLTDPEFLKVSLARVCFGVPACCSAGMFDPKTAQNLAQSPSPCQKITVLVEEFD